MKHIRILIAALFIFGLFSTSSEAQTVRRPVKRAVVKKHRKKKIRRKRRRVKRRVLRSLPVGTRPIAYRNIRYYPVGGMYFIRENDVYVRAFPKGLVVPTLAIRPIRLVVRGVAYSYAKGHFYQETDGGYTIVEPPIGAVVPELPEDAVAWEGERDGIYVLEDTFYAKNNDGFEIIAAPDEE